MNERIINYTYYITVRHTRISSSGIARYTYAKKRGKNRVSVVLLYITFFLFNSKFMYNKDQSKCHYELEIKNIEIVKLT